MWTFASGGSGNVAGQLPMEERWTITTGSSMHGSSEHASKTQAESVLGALGAQCVRPQPPRLVKELLLLLFRRFEQQVFVDECGADGAGDRRDPIAPVLREIPMHERWS